MNCVCVCLCVCCRWKHGHPQAGCGQAAVHVQVGGHRPRGVSSSSADQAHGHDEGERGALSESTARRPGKGAHCDTHRSSSEGNYENHKLQRAGHLPLISDRSYVCSFSHGQFVCCILLPFSDLFLNVRLCSFAQFVVQETLQLFGKLRLTPFVCSLLQKCSFLGWVFKTTPLQTIQIHNCQKKEFA